MLARPPITRLTPPRPPRLPPARASARPPPPDGGGDESVQDNLVEMLRLQVGQADIAAFADAEAAKLVESAEAVSREGGREKGGFSRRLFV